MIIDDVLHSDFLNSFLYVQLLDLLVLNIITKRSSRGKNCVKVYLPIWARVPLKLFKSCMLGVTNEYWPGHIDFKGRILHNCLSCIWYWSLIIEIEIKELNYAHNEEQLRYFSLENNIPYWDLKEAVQAACCLFRARIHIQINSNYQDINC